VASFDNLQVTCAPGGTVNLTITADQIYLSELDSSKPIFRFNFENVVEGKKYSKVRLSFVTLALKGPIV